MAPIWQGWHVLRSHRHLHHWPYTRVEVGVPLDAEGPLSLHGNGMHATQDILYALANTTGLYICRVRLVGQRLDEATQSCARTRVVDWMVNAEPVLYDWMQRCLTRALRHAGHDGAPVRAPIKDLLTLLGRHATQTPGDPLAHTYRMVREDMRCPGPLLPVLEAMMGAGVRTGRRLSHFPKWFYGGYDPWWNRLLGPGTFRPFEMCVSFNGEQTRYELCCKLVEMDYTFRALSFEYRKHPGPTAMLFRAAEIACDCVYMTAHYGAMSNGAGAALVAKCCAIVAEKARTCHADTLCCPEEEAWQRTTLEALLLARQRKERKK